MSVLESEFRQNTLAISAQSAEIDRIWADAFIEVGFSPDQAVQLVCAHVLRPQPAPPLPEYLEFLTKQNLLAETLKAEIDGDIDG